MTGFALRVDDEVDLVLRERWTAQPLHQLVIENLDRLRRWEAWSLGEQTLGSLQAYIDTCLRAWADGTQVPTAMRCRGRLVGTMGLRIDTWNRNAEIGYWIEATSEGLGIVTRSARALCELGASQFGVQRFEIRAAAGNVRSRAVAERLGFAHEGTLRAGMLLGGQRLDLAVYGLVV